MAGAPAEHDKLKAIGILADEIRSQRERLESLIQSFRQRIKKVGQIETRSDSAEASQGSGRYWRFVAFVDSLVRLRLFVEQNFNYVETMSVLSVARYLLELTVWLKLLEGDSRYGLVYHHQLLRKQLDFYVELRKNAEREISFLRQTDASERTLLTSRVSEMLKQGPSTQISSETFSLYAEQAIIKGYGFQASLVETKVLPDLSMVIADLEQKRKSFDRDVPSDVKALIPGRWKWNEQAERVGMKDEYDFIYAYASRLLHATPSSLTTNQKNLEPDEMRVFLKYIRVRLLDAVEMAEKLLAEDPAILQ